MPQRQGFGWNPIESLTGYDFCMVCALGMRLKHIEELITDRDYRSPKKPIVEYVESHSDDVTEVYLFDNIW